MLAESLFSLRLGRLGHVLVSDTGTLWAQEKVAPPLEQEFGHGIHEGQTRPFLEEQELPHLVDFEKDMISFGRNYEIDAARR